MVVSPQSNPSASRDDLAASLYHQHYRDLVRLATALTGDIGAGEEIVQDAFAVLLSRWWHLRDPQDAYAYLRRVVVNQTRHRWRRAQRLSTAITTAGNWPTPASDQADVESQLDLLAALLRLPQRKRACVVLRHYADLSEAETAALLGISIGTVKSQTAKGLHQLADDLGRIWSGVR